MLLELNIRNIALIERLRVELGAGLNVLTGETGAGKSIVVDALSLVLGGRADKGLIRNGRDRAVVEALFDVSENAEAGRLLSEWALPTEDGLLAIARELSENGRNLCRICGSIQPLGRLRQLTALLVDLHGQHEHQQLCDPALHLSYLDAYGDPSHQALIADVRTLYASYTALRREIQKNTLDASERERMRDMLIFQIGEIDEIKPKPGEDERLSQKNALLRNAERISEGIGRACDLVYRGAGRSISAQEALKGASSALSNLSGLDERFDALQKRLDELYYGAEDIGYELSALYESLDFNPDEADKIAARLSELKRLLRKYGPSLSDVISFRENAASRLNALDGGEDHLKALQKALDAQRATLDARCRELTERRRALAENFAARLLSELSELGMGRARFETRFEKLPDFSENGLDRAEFMLSANPGEPLRPLADVASGGELSRIMLAMKTIAADSAGVDAMVFDEIDTGVSGRMAQVVGEKMARIAGRRQVICVTHLPQIASLGDFQYLVEKTTDGEKTGTNVRLLDDEGRVMELARMVGGSEDLSSGRAHARNLLKTARARVLSIRSQEPV